jgi:hypothetical protein
VFVSCWSFQKAFPHCIASSCKITQFGALPEHLARVVRLQTRLSRSITKLEASAALREAVAVHTAAMLSARTPWLALATSLPIGPDRPNHDARAMAMRM